MAENSPCVFCKRGNRERSEAGQTFHKDGLTVHQYCLYFASGLYQRGDENEGIHGFLLADIRKEVSRAGRLTCRFCRQKGAATGCAINSCRQMCHASCGLANGFLFIHHGRFEAYCQTHRPTQKHILVSTALSKTRDRECSICSKEITVTTHDWFSILVCPVCITGFHRKCLQKQAWVAGDVFFRCSLCGDKNQFSNEMLRMGLEIPEKEDAWEDGKSVQQTECQATNCLCPDGRTFYTRMSKYRMKTCRECSKVIGHMVCVKGHLCAVCKSSKVEGVPRASSSTDGLGCVDVTVSPVAAQEPVKCDCIICQTKTLTPEPHLSSASPPLPPPITRPSSSPSSPPPSPIQIRLSSPPSSLKLPTTSPKPSPPKILNPRQDTTFLTPTHLQTPCLSQEPDAVSPVLSMLVEPPTPSSSLLSPSLSLGLSSPTSSATPCTPIVILDQLSAPTASLSSILPNTSSHPIQPIAQSLSDVENPRHLKKPVLSLNENLPTVNRNISPSSSNGSLISLASLGLQDRHFSPSSINSTLHSSSRQDSPPLSPASSPVCSYFNYVDVDDYFNLMCHEEVESVDEVTSAHEGGNPNSKLMVIAPDSTHQTIRKKQKYTKVSDNPATRTSVTEPPGRTVSDTQTSDTAIVSILHSRVPKSPSHTSKLYRNHRKLIAPSQDTTTKLKNSSNIDGTGAQTNSFTVHIPLHIFPHSWRNQLHKKQRTNRKVAQFLKARGLRQKYPCIILTRIRQSRSFHSPVTSSLDL